MRSCQDIESITRDTVRSEKLNAAVLRVSLPTGYPTLILDRKSWGTGNIWKPVRKRKLKAQTGLD